MLLIEKLRDVPLGEVLLIQFETRTFCPTVEQTRVDCKNVPDDFTVHVWLTPEIIGVKEELAP
jgi:hypothetical protein